MKETGILFTPDNIRAIREGRKTQTRRCVNGVADCYSPSAIKWCPYGVPGDRLYIKEGVIIDLAFIPPELTGYYMDGARATLPGEKRLTAMFMAKKYARTWLEITDIRVERLQDISEEDCVAEGVYNAGGVVLDHWYETGEIKTGYSSMGIGTFPTAKEGYKFMWDVINRKKHPFLQNPWVWVLEFKLIK